MQALFTQGSMVDGILALLAAEALVLLWVRRRGYLQAGRIDLLAALGAGAGLLLALRSTLRHDPWGIVAGWLALAGLAHAVDLARRIRRDRAGQRSF